MKNNHKNDFTWWEILLSYIFFQKHPDEAANSIPETLETGDDEINDPNEDILIFNTKDSKKHQPEEKF